MKSWKTSSCRVESFTKFIKAVSVGILLAEQNIGRKVLKLTETQCHLPGLSCRKISSLDKFIDGVEEEDAHGEEEQGGEGPLVDRLCRVDGGHGAVVGEVLLLELGHQLGDARVGVLSHGGVHCGQDFPEIHIRSTLSDVPGNGLTNRRQH